MLSVKKTSGVKRYPNDVACGVEDAAVVGLELSHLALCFHPKR